MKKAGWIFVLVAASLLIFALVACNKTEQAAPNPTPTAPVTKEAEKKLPPVTHHTDTERAREKQIDRTPPKDERPPMDLAWVSIPAGDFMMGCDAADDGCSKKEQPRHKVTISKPFQINPTLVTNGQYKKCVEAKACTVPKWDNYYTTLSANYPAVGVSWHQSKAFCEWVGGSLPTEAQWEYAARAGETGMSYGPKDDVAWHRENSNRVLHPVALKLPNAWGLYDVIGNAEQWVADYMDSKYYAKSPAVDPTGPESSLADYRVLRGSNFTSFRRLDLAMRADEEASNVFDGVGFRCVKSVAP
jgi:formylglycine-generating enzyme required for sulfatase activity